MPYKKIHLNQGLLEPSRYTESPQDPVKEAIFHGLKHFINEFNPASIAEQPGEFALNGAKSVGIALFHVATDGMFIGTEKAVVLATELHGLTEMLAQDHSNLTLEQRAELIAEKVADFIKIVVADKARGGTNAGKIATEGASKLTGKEEIRRIILNRERDVLPSDLKQLGFRGESCNKLNYVDKKTGNIDLFTEAKGDIERAKQILEMVKNEFGGRGQLVHEVHDIEGGRTFFKFSDGSTVQLRIEGKSGHPKVNIFDMFENIKEKITFK